MMHTCNRWLGGLLVLAMAAMLLMRPHPVVAASAAELNREAAAALQALYRGSPAAKELGTKAKGILVFPSIIKAGFIVGGQYGEGALRKGGKTIGYYNTVAASYGLQAGGQTFGYALFFMTDSALKYLDKSDGWEIGSGPSIVVVDEGTAGALTTTTAKDEVYAFFFSQKGLMGGLGLQGTKISRIKK
jgi:lipid-binding SYLF domain-containing protein